MEVDHSTIAVFNGNKRPLFKNFSNKLCGVILGSNTNVMGIAYSSRKGRLIGFINKINE